MQQKAYLPGRYLPTLTNRNLYRKTLVNPADKLPSTLVVKNPQN